MPPGSLVRSKLAIGFGKAAEIIHMQDPYGRLPGFPRGKKDSLDMSTVLRKNSILHGSFTHLITDVAVKFIPC